MSDASEPSAVAGNAPDHQGATDSISRKFRAPIHCCPSVRAQAGEVGPDSMPDDVGRKLLARVGEGNGRG